MHDDGEKLCEQASFRMHASRREVVCLCGSTRFWREYQQENFRLTMQGKIVLSVGFYPHSMRETHGDQQGITEEDKKALDSLHIDKIALADSVFIINVGGYVGSSTRREIIYAIMTHKKIGWLEPGKIPDFFAKATAIAEMSAIDRFAMMIPEMR